MVTIREEVLKSLGESARRNWNTPPAPVSDEEHKATVRRVATRYLAALDKLEDDERCVGSQADAPPPPVSHG